MPRFFFVSWRQWHQQARTFSLFKGRWISYAHQPFLLSLNVCTHFFPFIRFSFFSLLSFSLLMFIFHQAFSACYYYVGFSVRKHNWFKVPSDGYCTDLKYTNEQTVFVNLRPSQGKKILIKKTLCCLVAIPILEKGFKSQPQEEIQIQSP